LNLSALCSPGCEKVLINELKKLEAQSGNNFKIEGSFFGRVRFCADLRGSYLALMGLRTCDRILLELSSFHCEDFDSLFENCKAIKIEDYIPAGSGLVIEKVRARASLLRSERTVQAMAHKALIERLNSMRGVQADNTDGHQSDNTDDERTGTAFVRIYIEKNRADILLDISGESLYKRGYRAQSGPAPIRETSAAAVILMSGWKRKFPLSDPFCGSGTIAIEALLYACNIAPNMERDFALDRLLPGDHAVKKEAREFFRAQARLPEAVHITGSDRDNAAIENAKRNLQNAVKLYGLDNLPGRTEAAQKRLIIFNTLPMEQLKPYPETPGFIITNPPYGNRLQDLAAAEENYRNMRVLRENFPGWKLTVVSDNSSFEELFGAKSDVKTVLKRGAASLYVYRYTALAPQPEKSRTPPHGRAPYSKKPPGRTGAGGQRGMDYTW